MSEFYTMQKMAELESKLDENIINQINKITKPLSKSKQAFTYCLYFLKSRRIKKDYES